jgi:hypothetical protein
MYAKLFSRIAQSSLMEEDIETRYCFMMLLAIADSGGDVIGTDVALARTVNLPLDTFKRCIVALMAPDPDSNSQVHEGRRIMPSESGRGYLLVNYATYRSIKTAEEKKAYMREYMQRRRKLLKDKDVTAVNVCKTALSDVTHAEGEGEADGESEAKAEAFQPEEPPTASAKPRGVFEGKNSERLPSSEQSKRFAAIMGRRLTTEWSEDECAAYRKLGTEHRTTSPLWNDSTRTRKESPTPIFALRCSRLSVTSEARLTRLALGLRHSLNRKPPATTSPAWAW